MTRHEARDQALQLVFELEFNQDIPAAELFELAQECRDAKIDDYARRAVQAVADNLTDIDALLDRFSTKWRVTRLPKATLAVLRLAVAEIAYLDEPVGAIINEAVDLAKTYCGDEDPAYVNGVLGGFARERQGQQENA